MSLWALGGNCAYASLVFQGVASGKGAGIGGSNVVLTIQNTPTEQGCVGWSGSASIIGSAACPGGLSPSITGGDEKTGNSQTQAQTVTVTGVQSGFSLAVVLNVSEPGGTLFTVENLSLTIYAANGTVLFNSVNLTGAGVPPSGGITINSSFQGQGNLGFAFSLDAAEASVASHSICTSATQPGCEAVTSTELARNATNRIGLAALLTNTQGGNETFSVADFANVAIITPEPLTLLTMAGGLALIGFARRYRGIRPRG